jgi:hypothetical protein
MADIIDLKEYLIKKIDHICNDIKAITKPKTYRLLKHKKSGVVHFEDLNNDDYTACGYLMWPCAYNNFEQIEGDDWDVTCKRCEKRLFSEDGLCNIPKSRFRD